MECNIGDIFRLGHHYLMCGDATRKQDILKLLDTGGSRLVPRCLTDPPYGINLLGKKDGIICSSGRTYKPIKGDSATSSARVAFEFISTYSKQQVIFGGQYFSDFLPPRKSWLVWDKKQMLPSMSRLEMAWCSNDELPKMYEVPFVGCVHGEKGVKRFHPTQKPVSLMTAILKDYSNEGDTILDVFGGSGSVLIACEETNRTCLMMEIDPQYVEKIIERWETVSSGKAELMRSEELGVRGYNV